MLTKHGKIVLSDLFSVQFNLIEIMCLIEICLIHFEWQQLL